MLKAESEIHTHTHRKHDVNAERFEISEPHTCINNFFIKLYSVLCKAGSYNSALEDRIHL